MYHTYSYELKTMHFHLKFDDSTVLTHTLPNIRHIQSKYYGLYVAKDWIHLPCIFFDLFNVCLGNGNFFGFSF